MDVWFIIAAVVVFTGLILLLSIGLVLASRTLTPQGKVKVHINDDSRTLTVQPGGTLLSILAENEIFLPSACGGGGTCAMCKCKVLEGGGSLLPTEAGQVTKREAREGMRLSCQLKVKEDLRIEVPPEVMEIKKFEGTVRSNHNVATFIKELIVDLPEGERIQFLAGSYIQIDIPPYELSFKDFDIEEPYRADWDEWKLWDIRSVNTEPCFRAYSMASYPAEDDIIMLNVRIATPPRGMALPPGIASSYIFNLKPGDRVVMSGPYGEFFAKDTDREMCYIGGGAGMAPMRSHLFDLLVTKKSKRPITFWYGARSRREMFYDDEFKALAEKCPNFSYHVALSEPMPEDEWTGFTGFIHKAVLENYLNDHEDPQEIEYYLCGPPPMISAVNRMLYDLGVETDMIAYDEFG